MSVCSAVLRAARLGLGVGCVVLGGCDAPAPSSSPPVAEPTQALRPANARGLVPQDSRVVDYVLNANLDTQTHQIDGRATITWKNTTSHSTEHLPMHLYMNGFRAEDTVWMSKGRGTHRGTGQKPSHPWGYCDVATVQRLDGAEPIALKYAEGDDPSVMSVQLDRPVGPGETIELELEFTTQLPGVFARTGFSKDFYMVGQWFPKIGVLEPDGRWNNHVFTFHSEFYADFGDYEVHLEVPDDYVVGATGIRVDERTDGDRKHLEYRAQMVHDFAWTASPDFVEAFAEYEGIRIRQLLPTAYAGEAQAHADAQLATLKSMEARFGPYPWSTITIVHPPAGASGARGMEYPTFYTTDHRQDVPQVLRGLGFDERVSGVFTTVHEFGHQYFQGLLASNEYTQPWLDEGMNTMSNALAMMDRYADEPDPWLFKFADHPMTLTDFMRLDAGRGAGLQSVDQPADAFDPQVGVYGSVVYRRTATVMLTLRNIAGRAQFDKALRTYADRFRFRHPTGAELERVLVETLGRKVALGQADTEVPDTGTVHLDVQDYLDRGLRSAATADFRVHAVSNLPRVGSAGWRRDASGTLVEGDPPNLDPVDTRPDNAVEGIAVIQRVGDFIVPVEIEIEFADDTRTRVVWDARKRFRRLAFPGQRIRRVHIDPDGLVLLESNRRDNNRYAPGLGTDRRLARTVGNLSQTAALATLTGFGP